MLFSNGKQSFIRPQLIVISPLNISSDFVVKAEHSDCILTLIIVNWRWVQPMKSTLHAFCLITLPVINQLPIL